MISNFNKFQSKLAMLLKGIIRSVQEQGALLYTVLLRKLHQDGNRNRVGRYLIRGLQFFIEVKNSGGPANSELKWLDKIDETNYTSTLKSAIDNYVQKHATLDGIERAYTPHSTKQAFKSLDQKSQCFDLIKRLSESSLLILEIKTTTDLIKLSNYKKKQHQINIALSNVGIPIQYCYNLRDDYDRTAGDEYPLIYSNTSSPTAVCNHEGKLIHQGLHIPLKGLIDLLLNKGKKKKKSVYSDGCIAALFSEGIINRVKDLDLKLLCFAYNPISQEFFSMNSKDIIEVYNAYSKHTKLQTERINFKKANISSIENYLIKNQLLLVQQICTHINIPIPYNNLSKKLKKEYDKQKVAREKTNYQPIHSTYKENKKSTKNHESNYNNSYHTNYSNYSSNNDNKLSL